MEHEGSARRRSQRRFGALAAAAAAITTILVAAPTAQAASQFTLFDQNNVLHDEDTYMQPNPSGPTDWTSPAYKDGRAYLRVEVTQKPSDKVIGGQICMWRENFAEETCSGFVGFSSPGVYYADLGAPDSWWKKTGQFDYANVLDDQFQFVRLMLKDTDGELLMNRRCGAACYSKDDLFDHVPIRANLSMILVAPGSELVPPANWSDCPSWLAAACTGGGNPPPTDPPPTDPPPTDPPPTDPPPPAPDKDAALIVGRTNLIPADREYRNWLNNAGFDVTAIDDGAADTTNLDRFDVVVVSSSVDAGVIGTWIADVDAPILSNEPYIARRLGLGSGGTNLRRQRTIRIVTPGSPLADGNSGTTTVTSAPSDLGGIRGVDRNVDVVATAAASPSIATVVSVEAGTLLRTGAAPARRVGYFLGPTTPLSANAAAVSMFDASLGWLTGAPALPTTPWWNNSWEYRVPVVAQGVGVVQASTIVDAALDVTAPMQSAGAAFDPDSLRVVEVDGAGAVTNASVPFQFDPAPNFNARNRARGQLTIVPPGQMPAAGVREFHVYFDTTAKNHPPASVAAQVSVSATTDDGFDSWQVTAAGNEWIYHRAGGGFASLIDAGGNDWIDYSTAAESAGDFRGIPNAVPPRDGGYFHPGRTTANSTLVASGPLKVTIESSAEGGAYRSRWEIYPTFARMTMLAADGPYWFLYEGTPGGAIDGQDRVRRSGGANQAIGTTWSGDLAGDEWAAFLDLGVGRTLVVAQNGTNSTVDSYRLLDGAMTVFGFGRENAAASLTGVQSFVVSLVESTNATVVKRSGEAAARSGATEAGPVERRRAG